VPTPIRKASFLSSSKAALPGGLLFLEKCGRPIGGRQARGPLRVEVLKPRRRLCRCFTGRSQNADEEAPCSPLPPTLPSRRRTLSPFLAACVGVPALLLLPGGAAANGGWRLVLDTRFNGHSVPRPWRPYTGYSNAPGGSYWLPKHCVVRHGRLNMIEKHERRGPGRGHYFTADGGGWYSCAVRAGTPRHHARSDSVDHRVSFRARVVRSRHGIVSHRNLPLWWPRDGGWPAAGEEDWMENDGSLSGRGGAWHSHFHYSPGNLEYRVAYPSVSVTRWHIYVQERRAHSIRVWIDGRLAYRRRLTSAKLPDTIKQPVFQQENPIAGPPRRTTGREVIQIDWVKIKVPRRLAAVEGRGCGARIRTLTT
jgi:hypothetical protein